MSARIDLEQKIKSMSAKQIILAMVDGLKNPPCKIDMTSFGTTYRSHLKSGEQGKRKVCFGCAATVTICKIARKKFNANNIDHRIKRSAALRVDFEFLHSFELAIDCLRRGNLGGYNNMARSGGFATIDFQHVELPPHIDNINYKKREVLSAYRKLAMAQK